MQLSIISCRYFKAEIVLVVKWPWKHETHASNYLSERIHETICDAHANLYLCYTPIQITNEIVRQTIEMKGFYNLEKPGDFTHIIVGSVEMWMVLLAGGITPGEALTQFFIPVLAGNVFGGTSIFSALAWGQVKEELAPNGHATDVGD